MGVQALISMILLVFIYTPRLINKLGYPFTIPPLIKTISDLIVSSNYGLVGLFSIIIAYLFYNTKIIFKHKLYSKIVQVLTTFTFIIIFKEMLTLCVKLAVFIKDPINFDTYQTGFRMTPGYFPGLEHLTIIGVTLWLVILLFTVVSGVRNFRISSRAD